MSVIRNPALMLAMGLPAVAVLACALTIAITIRNPDAPLPEQYHWEGFQLDRDFSQAARASDLQVRATLSGFGSSGRCEVQLRMAGAAPDVLVLRLAHATRPALDQDVTFERKGSEMSANRGVATYAGECREAPDSHWRLELVDAVNGWAVRQSVRGPIDGIALDASRGRASK
jgi:hypothetical protein